MISDLEMQFNALLQEWVATCETYNLDEDIPRFARKLIEEISSRPSWTEGKTASGAPQAVLKHDDKVIAKVYLSPDLAVLRIVLEEFVHDDQIKVDLEHKIIDFRRKVGHE